ncbi:hypothetical protein FACS189491_09580 [Spirochaetia bacterium]|nr:hypothetical protein FACS189491_09580 [Spirochaetia bacterium]
MVCVTRMTNIQIIKKAEGILLHLNLLKKTGARTAATETASSGITGYALNDNLIPDRRIKMIMPPLARPAIRAAPEDCFRPESRLSKKRARGKTAHIVSG